MLGAGLTQNTHYQKTPIIAVKSNVRREGLRGCNHELKNNNSCAVNWLLYCLLLIQLIMQIMQYLIWKNGENPLHIRPPIKSSWRDCAAMIIIFIQPYAATVGQRLFESTTEWGYHWYSQTLGGNTLKNSQSPIPKAKCMHDV